MFLNLRGYGLGEIKLAFDKIILHHGVFGLPALWSWGRRQEESYLYVRTTWT